MAIIKNSNIVLSSDIGSVLNAAGGSVNINQPATFFTSAAKINSSAKYKPVILPYNFLDKDSTPTMHGYWWRGNDGKCGFTIPSVDKYITEQSEDSGWTYNLPSGTSTEPRRLGDFRGYNTDAVHDWLSIHLPTNIVVGQSMSYSMSPIKPNESSLSYYESVDELWLNFKAMSSTNSGYDYQIPLDDALSSPGRIITDIPSSEINKWGIIAGTTIRVHLYAKKDGVVVSARNHSSIRTFWTMKATSAEPYNLWLSVMTIYISSSTMTIQNLTAVADATKYAGGTIASGSRVMVFKYVAEDTNYLSYYTSLWSSTLPEITVAAGESWNKNWGVQNVRVSDTSIRKVMIIWYDSQNRVLTKISQDVGSL